MALKAAVQRRTGHVRNRGLQGIGAGVQRQQRVRSERDDRRLLGFRQHRGPRLRRPGLPIHDRRAQAPLRHRLGIDVQLAAQLRERNLVIAVLQF